MPALAVAAAWAAAARALIPRRPRPRPRLTPRADAAHDDAAECDPACTPAPAQSPGLAGRPGGLFGGGLLGGLAAGFIGAGLFGMLFGHGFVGGLGGFASLLGLLLQIGLGDHRRPPGLGLVAAPPAAAGYRRRPVHARQRDQQWPAAWAACSAWVRRRSPRRRPARRSRSTPQDFDAFEKLLGDVQTAYGEEDLTRCVPT